VRDARYFDDDLYAVRVGFADITLMVQDTVQELCRPCLAIELSEDFSAPMMWEFGNLLERCTYRCSGWWPPGRGWAGAGTVVVVGPYFFLALTLGRENGVVTGSFATTLVAGQP
jgi:hypothetical protein